MASEPKSDIVEPIKLRQGLPPSELWFQLKDNREKMMEFITAHPCKVEQARLMNITTREWNAIRKNRGYLRPYHFQTNPIIRKKPKFMLTVEEYHAAFTSNRLDVLTAWRAIDRFSRR